MSELTGYQKLCLNLTRAPKVLPNGYKPHTVSCLYTLAPSRTYLQKIKDQCKVLGIPYSRKDYELVNIALLQGPIRLTHYWCMAAWGTWFSTMEALEAASMVTNANIDLDLQAMELNHGKELKDNRDPLSYFL